MNFEMRAGSKEKYYSQLKEHFKMTVIIPFFKSSAAIRAMQNFNCLGVSTLERSNPENSCERKK